MEINDLMVSDYVELNGSICVVDEISQKGWIHLSYIEDDVRVPTSSDYILDFIKDIPVTDEILEKNGFWYEQNVGWVLDCDGHEVIYDSWDHTLRINYNRKTILDLEFFGQMSVRELQHALRLCEVGKEIELSNEKEGLQ